MRSLAPFQADDLDELDRYLLARADAIVPMKAIAKGVSGPNVIGLRHDVDNVIEPAVAFSEWEAERGYLSTYYILHTSPYWQDKPLLERSLERIASLGHEIGFHVNAITQALETGQSVHEIVEEGVAELRGYGHEVTGVVAHGDSSCYRHNFVNDEIFVESSRPTYGAAHRLIGGKVWLNPVPRSMYGFEYDPNWLPRAAYLSDSGGRWSRPFDDVTVGFPFDGQLHMLVHADWWPQAFPLEQAAA